jgi:GNAT superfamily N-acetyltransferase
MRTLTRNDYAAYFPLINEFRHTQFTEYEFKAYMDTLPSNIEIWVIEDGNRLVATATLIFEPKLIFDMCTFAHIEDVCVASDYRKKGIGSILMKDIVKRCDEKGCRKVTLVCNESVAPFYFANGFEKRGIQCSMLLRDSHV